MPPPPPPTITSLDTWQNLTHLLSQNLTALQIAQYFFSFVTSHFRRVSPIGLNKDHWSRQWVLKCVELVLTSPQWRFVLRVPLINSHPSMMSTKQSGSSVIAGSSNPMCLIVSHDSIQDKCSTGQILLNISYITGYPKLKVHHYNPLQVIRTCNSHIQKVCTICDSR